MAVIEKIRLGLTLLGFIILAYTYIAAGFIISALMLCSCVIWPINKTIYRIINVHLGWCYWSFYTFLGSWWSNSECYVYTDMADFKHFGKENCICIQNHRYEIDWLMTSIVAENFQMLGNHKVYSKNSHKYVPLVGWTWYFSESIFLKRNWQEDKSILKTGLKNLTEYPDNYPVYMYPEGTRFTEEKYQSSLEVSRSRGYPDMKHHLLPRPKGFTAFVRDMKGKFAAVYDSEIVFEKHPKPSISTIAQRIPVIAHLSFKRYKLEDIPCKTDEECAEWLRNLYLDKDKTFDEFINNEKLKGTPYKIPKSSRGLLNVFFWCFLTCYPLFNYLCNVIVAGTSTQRIIVSVAFLFVVVILRWIISVTEIQDGGQTTPKSTQNGKQD
ncbi:hypothetical protein LOTGIDRAFT_121170 [Lottia gigantea]|uniref:Phospholipid/glycerol acyltransferase domain-containing protein n=1 Tax=Lottia gigantea TaxID=225164 RepID=V3ZLN0_LOTGI|nr:hypothetical protein LOTGIDRAFT_121170 [Lottia gigantea]ESO92258.1 hypothetical protein LOTGIDRAFT_121170 [Lottia gigantea]